MFDLTVFHGLLLGSLLALPLALIRKPRLRLVTGIVPTMAAALVIFATSTHVGREVTAQELPSGVMDIEMLDDGTALAVLGDGRLLSIEIVGGRIVWSVAATGLTNPRGIAVIGEQVFVSELGSLPCPGWCMGPEELILNEASGRVTRLRFQGQSLIEPTTIVEGLPVVSYEHGPNDIERSPEDELFLSVGHVSSLVEDPEALAAIDHEHLEWLGTVLRIDPEQGSVTIHARGLRNVYGLTFSPDGRLFGVDNDGHTLGTWRHEELLELRKDADYGYPGAGTFDVTRRTLPLGIVSGVGAGGILWRDGDVIVGTESGIERHELRRSEDGRYSSRRPTLIDIPSCLYVAAIAQVDQSRLVIGCANGRLALLDLT
jgi:hypothetical protein